ASEILNGVLVSQPSKRLYAVADGVPIMFDEGLPRGFTARFAKQIDAALGSGGGAISQFDQTGWSFSAQWRTDEEMGMERTWGYTTESRLEQMLIGTGRPREWYRGKLVLDAGCGNGRLTDRMTTLGAQAIGIDFSDSVLRAHKLRSSPLV